MFYAILPPAMIVIGVAGLVWIIAKRSKDIASLQTLEMPQGVETVLPPRTLRGKVIFYLKNIPWNDIKVWLLATLEKTTKRIRVWFLRADSHLNQLSHQIRHKRQACEDCEPEVETNKNDHLSEPTVDRVKERISVENKESFESGERRDIMQKLREYKISKNIQPDIVKSTKNSITQKVVIEKRVRPMVSEKVTEPQPNPETKNHLEKILIERIAVNARDVEAYERLGEYYLDIENYEFAKECLKQVLKLAPTNRSAKYKMKKIENALASK